MELMDMTGVACVFEDKRVRNGLERTKSPGAQALQDVGQ